MKKSTRRGFGTGKGKPIGYQNRLDHRTQLAMIKVMNELGCDGRGADGVLGYLRYLAAFEPDEFGAMLREARLAKLLAPHIPLPPKREKLPDKPAPKVGALIGELYCNTSTPDDLEAVYAKHLKQPRAHEFLGRSLMRERAIRSGLVERE